MTFTVHLRCEETWEEDFTYGLVFTPNPKWVQGGRLVLDMRATEPGYRIGSVRALLRAERLARRLRRPRAATILAHHVGLGTGRDYQNLIVDLEQEGFATTIYE